MKGFVANPARDSTNVTTAHLNTHLSRLEWNACTLLPGGSAVSVRVPCSCVLQDVALAGTPKGTDDAVAAGQRTISYANTYIL